jgi:hypothetical protein
MSTKRPREPDATTTPTAPQQHSRTVLMHFKHMLFCTVDDLHEILLTRGSSLDLNAMYPVKHTPLSSRTINASLLYWAIQDSNTERIALLLLFGADPLVPCVVDPAGAVFV